MSWTTWKNWTRMAFLLWFAFKIFDLWCREQQQCENVRNSQGCDLLSKFSIFDVVNNQSPALPRYAMVVICLQNFRSLMSWTTYKIRRIEGDSCDLLSKFSIFDVVNNKFSGWCYNLHVVICFQNFRSLMSWTTAPTYQQVPFRCDLLSKFSIFDVVNNPATGFIIYLMLWFAFKIFDLWCREQPCAVYN